MSVSILTARRIAALALVFFSIVVLGLSAHVETSVRTFGLSTKSYTLACFTAALTIAGEIAFAVIQWRKPMPILNMGAFFLVIWVFWLASSISVTVSTSDGRSFCSNLNNLTNDPELADLDPELLKMAKKALKSACSEIHASLAFSWMSFVLSTFMAIGLIVLGLRERRNGNHHADAWNLSVMRENGRTEAPADPFADPVAK
ncbi:hypothetical protein NCC49_005160 [Naganishia albida]|nr:hypothetical protein NCC49_005160 [Naganishia albida]